MMLEKFSNIVYMADAGSGSAPSSATASTGGSASTSGDAKAKASADKAASGPTATSKASSASARASAGDTATNNTVIENEPLGEVNEVDGKPTGKKIYDILSKGGIVGKKLKQQIMEASDPVQVLSDLAFRTNDENQQLRKENRKLHNQVVQLRSDLKALDPRK